MSPSARGHARSHQRIPPARVCLRPTRATMRPSMPLPRWRVTSPSDARVLRTQHACFTRVSAGAEPGGKISLECVMLEGLPRQTRDDARSGMTAGAPLLGGSDGANVPRLGRSRHNAVPTNIHRQHRPQQIAGIRPCSNDSGTTSSGGARLRLKHHLKPRLPLSRRPKRRHSPHPSPRHQRRHQRSDHRPHRSSKVPCAHLG